MQLKYNISGILLSLVENKPLEALNTVKSHYANLLLNSKQE